MIRPLRRRHRWAWYFLMVALPTIGWLGWRMRPEPDQFFDPNASALARAAGGTSR